MKPYKTVAVVASYFNDLESAITGNWLGTQDSEKFFSGALSNKLDDQHEYGLTFTIKVTEIPQHEKIRELKINFQVFSEQHLKKASFVCAVTGAHDKVYEYFQEEIRIDPKKWLNAEISMPVNGALWGNDAVLKIYPWNAGKEIFFLDDIRIELLSEIEKQQDYSFGPQQNFLYDFEPVNGDPLPEKLSTDVAHSGKHSLKLSGSDTYSESIIKHFSEVSTDTVKFVSTSVWIYPKEENPVVTLVVSIEKPDGTSIAWNGKATDRFPLKKNVWQKINFRADLRQTKTSPDDIVKIYVWNKKGGTVYADDFEIVYGDIPKPAGLMPGIKMSMIGDQISNPGMNKPPFKTSYFSKADFFIPSATYINSERKNKEGVMNPGNVFLAGFFSSTPRTAENIFIAGARKWTLYSWSKGEKNIVTICSNDAAFNTDNKVILKGFFNSLENEDILFIDSSGEKNIQCLRFKYVPGSALQQEMVNVPMPAADSASLITAGEFMNDKKDELLFIAPDGNWKIFSMKNGNFELRSEGNISRGKILSIHAIETGSVHKKLLLFSERDNKLDYCLVDFSNGAQASVKEFKDKNFLDYYHRQASFFAGAFEKVGATSLFYFNPEWRFDLKKISLTDNGLVIDSQIDFIQKDPARNPRYYEYTKIIQGKFFEDRTDYLLVLMQNCKDPNFDGKHCYEFEEIKEMPGGFGFYHYQPAR